MAVSVHRMTQRARLTVNKTSDDAWIFLPVTLTFCAFLAYVSFWSTAENGGPPETFRALSPFLLPFCLCLVLVKTYQVFYPVSCRAEIFDDRIVFRRSSRAEPDTVVRRSETKAFFTEEHRWYHGDTDRHRLTVCRLKDGREIKIERDYVQDVNREEVYDMVISLWGPEFVVNNE